MLAWLLVQRPWIVPIPGTRLERARENAGAADIALTPDDLTDIPAVSVRIEVRGARLAEATLQLSYR